MSESTTYKQRFISLLNRRKELEETQAELYRQARELGNDLNSNMNDIDLVFADILKNDYPFYESMTNSSNNSVYARYVHEGKLFEIERNMGYSNPIERIKVKTKSIM